MRGRRCCAGEGNLILTYLLVTLITLPIFVLTTPEITAGICGTLWPVNSLLNVVNSPPPMSILPWKCTLGLGRGAN